jgi:FAD dependent oxidoreductase
MLGKSASHRSPACRKRNMPPPITRAHRPDFAPPCRMGTLLEDSDWILIDLPIKSNPPSKDMNLVKDPGLPRSNPLPSSWLIPADSLAKYQSSETLPSDIVDVVIIGSGFSGASVAWHLLHGDGEPRTKYLSCVMLEARDVCSGATGRNGTPHRSIYLSCAFGWALTGD